MRRRRSLLPFVLLTFLLAAPDAVGQSPVPEGAEVERIAQGFQFVEGPVWHDGGLLFSDIPANTVYRWTPDGEVEEYRTPSQNSNGLAFDAEGRLLLAQHGARRVARLEEDGTETPLATHYEDDRLNSPNDLALHPDGSIYFTDPPWGVQEGQRELDFTGVYRIAPDGSLHLLVDSLFYPNGIAFSPDAATLYVSTSHQRTVVAFDVADHALSNERVFATLANDDQDSDAADGMKMDAEGRLYVTGPGGVWIYAPDGTLLDRIDVPEQTTNLAWGGEDGRTLYITSGTSVYRIPLDAGPTGTQPRPQAPDQGSRLLQPLYPNPTSGAVAITYELATPATVDVLLLDVLGRTVRSLEAGFRTTGSHTLRATVAELPSDVYFVRVQAGSAAMARPLVVR